MYRFANSDFGCHSNETADRSTFCVYLLGLEICHRLLFKPLVVKGGPP